MNKMATNVERPLEWMRFDPVKFGLLVEGESLEVEGAFMRVLRHLWLRGPLSEADVRKLCRTSFDIVLEAMIEVDGMLSLQFVEDARSHGKARQAQTIKAGQASAAKRIVRSTDVQRKSNGRSTSVLSMSLSNSSSSTSEKERASETIRDQFLRLWEVFERHGVRKTAAEYWAKLPQQDRDAIMRVAPEYVASTSGDRLQYRKHLEGWINPKNRLWERPVIKRNDAPQAMTRERADAMLAQIRKDRNLGPYSPILYEWMPKELREFELR